MYIQISLDIGSVVEWVSAFGTVGAVLFSIWQNIENRKYQKNNQILVLKEKQGKLENMENELQNIMYTVTNRNQKYSEMIQTKTHSLETVEDSWEFLNSKRLFLYDVEKVLKENDYYSKAESVNKALILIEKHKHRDRGGNFKQEFEQADKVGQMLSKPEIGIRVLKEKTEEKLSNM